MDGGPWTGFSHGLPSCASLPLPWRFCTSRRAARMPPNFPIGASVPLLRWLLLASDERRPTDASVVAGLTQPTVRFSRLLNRNFASEPTMLSSNSGPWAWILPPLALLIFLKKHDQRAVAHDSAGDDFWVEEEVLAIDHRKPMLHSTRNSHAASRKTTQLFDV